MPILKVTFRNMEASEALETYAHLQLKKLQEITGPLNNCEVVVSKEHRQDQPNAFQVHLRIGVRGEEIVVNQEHLPDETNSDPYKVLRDAFDTARRQLQEYHQRRRGEVKFHFDSFDEPRS